MPSDSVSNEDNVVIIIEDDRNILSTELAQCLSQQTGFKIAKPFQHLRNKREQRILTEKAKNNDQVAPWQLVFTEKGLSLRMTFEPSWGDIRVDFTSASMQYRKDKGGGKNEAIAKAIGIKSHSSPTVIDCTAGMGSDSYVMASVGANVTMVERNTVVAALLENALMRAQDDEVARNRLRLVKQDALAFLEQTNIAADVIYLDPMFPHKKKSALVKKEMRAFQSLLGGDIDSEQLLALALEKSVRRVVVKRPGYAPPINHSKQPSMAIASKKHRFDVYLINSD